MCWQRIRSCKSPPALPPFRLKERKSDIKTIAEELNVTHVLEGSVRKAGDELRITAQLIEVATDSHLWSQTYDRQMENIFAVQDDIAGSVAGALKADTGRRQDSKSTANKSRSLQRLPARALLLRPAEQGRSGEGDRLL